MPLIGGAALVVAKNRRSHTPKTRPDQGHLFNTFVTLYIRLPDERFL